MSVFELRQYVLLPASVKSSYVCSRNRSPRHTRNAGMKVVGTFRDLDDDSKFVWIRSFPNMAERERGLGAFYYGPVWESHRDAANATMLSSDDVLLLRPASEESSTETSGRRRPFDQIREHEVVDAVILTFAGPVYTTALERLHRQIPP